VLHNSTNPAKVPQQMINLADKVRFPFEGTIIIHELRIDNVTKVTM
jgi:hypothetical protein